MRFLFHLSFTSGLALDHYSVNLLARKCLEKLSLASELSRAIVIVSDDGTPGRTDLVPGCYIPTLI